MNNSLQELSDDKRIKMPIQKKHRISSADATELIHKIEAAVKARKLPLKKLVEMEVIEEKDRQRYKAGNHQPFARKAQSIIQRAKKEGLFPSGSKFFLTGLEARLGAWDEAPDAADIADVELAAVREVELAQAAAVEAMKQYSASVKHASALKLRVVTEVASAVRLKSALAALLDFEEPLEAGETSFGIYGGYLDALAAEIENHTPLPRSVRGAVLTPFGDVFVTRCSPVQIHPRPTSYADVVKKAIQSRNTKSGAKVVQLRVKNKGK